MKVLKLAIDLAGITLSKEDKSRSPQDITALVIKNIILTYGNLEHGLGEEERRKFYKLVDILEVGVKAKAETIDLEDDYAAFILKCRSKAKMLPGELLRLVEKNLDEIKDK